MKHLWQPDRQLYYSCPVPGVIASASRPTGVVPPIEAVNGSAVQVTLTVDTAARQTWLGYGWGGGIPLSGGVGPARGVRVAANITSLFTELDTKVIRLNDPNNSNFIEAFKPVTDVGIANGVDIIVATGYYKRNTYTPTVLADKVKAAIDGGIPITHVSLQNEPDGGDGGGDVVEAQLAADNTTLRNRLNAIGLPASVVKIIGCEWAHFVGAPPRSLSEYDALNAAGAIPNVVAFGCGHCYSNCPNPDLYDNRWKTHGIGLFSTETGNQDSPHFGARIIAGMAHGTVVEVAHLGQAYTPSDDNNQVLVFSDGARQPAHAQARVISKAIARGSVFRRLHNSDRPPGLDVTKADLMIRNLDMRKPRIMATCALRPDGKWALVAVNDTYGSDTFTNNANGHYGAALIQVTITIPALVGTDRFFNAQRCTMTGTTVTPQTVNMKNGQMRFTLSAGDTIGMVAV